MEHRKFERLGREVSVIGLGAWQLGADWGEIPEDRAIAIIRTAIDEGIDFIDTADIYGDGRSERLIGKALGEMPGHEVMVATKMGQRLESRLGNYTLENFREWTRRSRENLGVETLDLVQLHCPPADAYESDRVFDDLDTLVSEGSIAGYGLSVSTCDQALKAIARPSVASIQLILNALRLKPLDEVLPAASRGGVGVIVRLPLASGLLSGRLDASSEFPEDDHRNYNRRGEAFDVGETFSGVPFDIGLQAVAELAGAVPEDLAMAQFAIRWVLDQPGVTVAIPGASSPEQVVLNTGAGRAPSLTEGQLATVGEVYDRRIRPLVHDRW